MATLISIKTFLKKIGTFLKHYWYVPLVPILWLWFLFINKKDNVKDVLDTSKESFKSQIDVINKSHKEEIERKEKITKKYLETIDLIEKKYEENKMTLSDKKRKRVKEILDKHHSNSVSMAFLLGQEFGIKYIPPEEGEE
jgi:hypothetical protein